MALQRVTKIQTAALQAASLTADSVHDIGTVPNNCVILAAGSECVSAANVGGGHTVTIGNDTDADALGSFDINTAKGLNATITAVNGFTSVTNADTVMSATMASSNAPTAGAFRFFVVYAPMGATEAGALADRDYLTAGTQA